MIKVKNSKRKMKDIKKKLILAAGHRNYINFEYDTPGKGISSRLIVVKRLEDSMKDYYYVMAVYNNIHRKFRSDRIINVNQYIE